MTASLADRWHPMRVDPPASVGGWHFNPPPGWPVQRGWKPPADWHPDLSWPPAPQGWQFWIERWHGYLALGSLITAGLAVALMANGEPAGIFFGLVIIVAVFAAGWVSRFWSAEKLLPSGPRLLVWAVALPGMVTGICFVLTFVIMDKMWDFYNKYIVN